MEEQAKVQARKGAAVKMPEQQLEAAWHATDSSSAWPKVTATYSAPTASTYIQASNVTST